MIDILMGQYVTLTIPFPGWFQKIEYEKKFTNRIDTFSATKYSFT